MTFLKNLADEAHGAYQCWRAGLIKLENPVRLLSGIAAVRRYGAIGGLITLSSCRYGARVALIDELGRLSYTELDQRSNAIANSWRQRGLKAGDGVGILVRNHRGFLDALFAAGKCGARIVLFNTDFAGPQIEEVADREGVVLLVHDDEYSSAVAGLNLSLGTVRAWAEGLGLGTLEFSAMSGSLAPPPAPEREAQLVILTSGTTGTPRGAVREEPRGLTIAGGMLGKVPFRAGEVTECCAPMFHALGLAQALLALGMGSTLVVRRRFEPRAVLESLVDHRVTALIVVPVMLRKMLELEGAVARVRVKGNLRIIFVAGSQLGGELCQAVVNSFGPVVHNLYGSTEVAYATIATPADLSIDPNTVGRAVRGVTVKILDDDGEPVPIGVTGRIFVGSSVQFGGYTGGGDKERIAGLMSAGDLGHLDSSGRLFIDGREDDMIVSGGENVFPGEVEEVLSGHPDIVEAAALGVPDPEFGQRLRVFVVPVVGACLDEEGVKAFVRANLARYKIPRDVLFLRELPRNPTGKVLKKELRNYASGESVPS